ncbi:MAG: phosphatase PAP2 family protein [Marinilabiliaceae bacterium]|nr:phosphatase PAP2 family protein [Marinilabiliaceae bacterium]
MLKYTFTTFLMLLSGIILHAQDIQYIDESLVEENISSGGQLYVINPEEQYIYFKPQPLSFIGNSFKDIYLAAGEAVKKENLWGMGAIAASTAILIVYDEEITAAAKQFGRFINLEATNDAKNISPIEGVSFFVPTDLASSLYYIGDGITELSVNLGFYIYGWCTKDARALRTATQLTEGMIAVGTSVQVLKHLTGRSTAMMNNDKDLWRPFPSLQAYHSSVPAYDAFPSGHLATAMMTTTVIAMNYPEYKFVKPLCYTLMGLCGYQMLNNGVHWAGDYPLALAMGYTMGKIAVNRGRYKVQRPMMMQNRIQPKFDLVPTVLDGYASGLTLSVVF